MPYRDDAVALRERVAQLERALRIARAGGRPRWRNTALGIAAGVVVALVGRFAPSPRASAPPSVPRTVHDPALRVGVVVRARVTLPERGAFTDPGDPCVLAVEYGPGFGPCAATLSCLARRFDPPDVVCDADLRLAADPIPALRRLRPAHEGRFPEVWLDLTAHTLLVRDGPSAELLFADVTSVTTFALPGGA